jgi:uncharacterized protein (TIGR03084 family)
MMRALCADLRSEYEELANLVASLTPRQWEVPTGPGRTVWDEVAVLLTDDLAALDALRDARAFARDLREFADHAGEGPTGRTAWGRELYGELDGATLLAEWRPVAMQLVERLLHCEPDTPVPWVGRQLSAEAFAAHRMAECWAHAQDIWDALHRRRPQHARLVHLASLAVRLHADNFRARGETPPGPCPYLELRAPDGQLWRWGEPQLDESVRGSAADFCLVATRRRHAADTLLEIVGPGATAWMEIVQCFGGPPLDGPARGERRVQPTDESA